MTTMQAFKPESRLSAQEAQFIIDLHKRGILPTGTSIVIPTDTRKAHHELELYALKIESTIFSKLTTITL